MMPSVSPTKLVFIKFQSSFELGVAIAVNETYQKFADPHVKLKIEEAIAATMDGITAAHVSVVRVCAVPPGCASRRRRLLRRRALGGTQTGVDVVFEVRAPEADVVSGVNAAVDVTSSRIEPPEVPDADGTTALEQLVIDTIVDRIASERSDSISADTTDAMRTRHMLKMVRRSTFTHFLVIIDITP